MSYHRRQKTRGSSRAVTTTPISSYFQDTSRARETRGGLRPTSLPLSSMAASQHSVPSSLAGLPPILDPAPGASGCTGLASQPAGVDADIRALLGAFPTKVDMEALVLRVEEQHRRDFQQIRAEVGGLDDRLTRGEASVSVLEARVAQMEQAHSLYQDQLAEVQLHAEDLENRSRRNNLRLRGLPEATGPENLLETVR